MPLIPMQQVRSRLRTTIPAQAPYRAAEAQKRENIRTFSALSREELKSGVVERRLLLYKTLAGEQVYLQYPGTESTREGLRQFPLDAKPKLLRADGTWGPDMDFKRIWDVIDRIGQAHCADIDILAVIFLRIAYMLGYRRQEGSCLCETVDMETGEVLSSWQEPLVWNALCLDRDVMETLNDRFGSFDGVSLEGFLYYNDLLAQNEDCKYAYLQGDNWNISAGRINNCLSHLTVISHLRGEIGISKLIDSFQRTGVAPLPQRRLREACGDLVQTER